MTKIFLNRNLLTQAYGGLQHATLPFKPFRETGIMKATIMLVFGLAISINIANAQNVYRSYHTGATGASPTTHQAIPSSGGVLIGVVATPPPPMYLPRDPKRALNGKVYTLTGL